MIQRFIGQAVGAVVVYAVLWWNHVDSTVALTAAVVGGIAAFLWPIIVGWYLVRRHRQKQENAMQEEVAKQVAAQQRPPGQG